MANNATLYEQNRIFLINQIWSENMKLQNQPKSYVRTRN